MSVARHPWLDGRFATAADLDDHVRVWTFLAAHTASGDLDGVRLDWRHLGVEHQLGGFEAVLQTHLFAGYPRAINALAAVHEVGVAADVPRRGVEHDGDLDSGEGLCRRIYGAGYDGLRRRVALLHPALDRWMVEIGYGRVLSRPGLSAPERELCAIAVLAGMSVAPQLDSHLRGAVRVGATTAQARAVLDQTGAVWGDAAQAEADRVWERVLPRL